MGSFDMYLTSTKWLWHLHVKKPKNNTMGMGVHKILKWMENFDLENQVKIVTLEKWLIMKSNWRCYRHPLVAPPNLGANLTLLVHHESLCPNPKLKFIIKARACKGAGQEWAQESHFMLQECRKVWWNEPSHSQMNSHFGNWSPNGFSNF